MDESKARCGEDAAAAESGAAREECMRSVVQGLRLVFRSIQEHSRWVEKQCGVSAAQLWTMWELHARPGLRVSELSRALSIHQSTASNLLDKLERKALIERQRRGPDHRVVQLYLTDKGRQLVEHAPRPAQGALSSGLMALPDPVLASLNENIASLVKAMDLADHEAALEPLSGG